MPSPFNGKWRLAEVSGVREFVEAVKTPEAHRVRLLALAEELKKDPEFVTEEIEVHEALGTFHRRIHVKGHPGKDHGERKFGVEYEGLSADDRPAKFAFGYVFWTTIMLVEGAIVRVVLENDHKIVRHDHVEGINVVTTLEVVGDHLHITSVGNGATSVLKLVKI